jgi:hypothetical protein
MAPRPWFLKRTSTQRVSHHPMDVRGAEQHTDRSRSSINAVLNKLLADRLKVNDDLARLNLVNRAALDGLDSGHVSPCWSRDAVGDATTRSRGPYVNTLRQPIRAGRYMMHFFLSPHLS